MKTPTEVLDQLSDSDILNYCCRRMLLAFRNRNGLEFRHGQIVWIIHEGFLAQIEDCPRYQSFRRSQLAAKS